MRLTALPLATLSRWGEHLGDLATLHRVRDIREKRAARLVSEAERLRQAKQMEHEAACEVLQAAEDLRVRTAQLTDKALRRGVKGGWQVLGLHACVDKLAAAQRARSAEADQASAAAEQALQAWHASRQRWWRERQRGEALHDVHRQAAATDAARREWIAEEDQP
jgi:hypothetical protein